MSFFKSSKKQSTTAPTTAPAPALTNDLAPPPYSPQDPAQKKVSKQPRKMTEQEAFSSLVEQAWGAPDKDI
ncbi:hypothetical protein BGZ96_005572, partial [Linnemannia gamsii]